MLKMSRKHQKVKGFTLIELLVVLGIIALLVTLGIVAVNYARERARIAKAQHDMAELFTAISVLANDTNEWTGHQPIMVINSSPSNEICDEDKNSNSCTIKLSDPAAGLVDTDGSYAGWLGPYIKKIPLDPWGREYFFDTDYQIDIDDNPVNCGGGGSDNAVVIGSYGPDEQGKPTSGSPGSYGCDDIIKIIVQ